MNDLRTHPTAELADFAEGALDPKRHSRVEAHLGTCDSCQAEVAGWRDLYTAFEALPRPRAPRSLSVRVMAAIAAEPVPVRAVRTALLPALREQLMRALTWSYAAGVAFTAALVIGITFVPVVRHEVGLGLGSAAALALRAGMSLLDGLTAISNWSTEASKALFSRFEWLETIVRAFETVGNTAQASTALLALIALSAAALALLFVRFLHSGSRGDEVHHVGPLLA